MNLLTSRKVSANTPQDPPESAPEMHMVCLQSWIYSYTYIPNIQKMKTKQKRKEKNTKLSEH